MPDFFMMNTSENIIYLGKTKDSGSHRVFVYTDGVIMFALYNVHDNNLHVAGEFISKIKESPEHYVFTPYIEFIDLV